MLLLEVLGPRRGTERPEYYRDLRLGLLLMVAILFSLAGLTRRQPSPGWLAIGCISLLVVIGCLYFANNRKAILAGVFAFVALRGLIGFLFFKSYWALAVTLVCIRHGVCPPAMGPKQQEFSAEIVKWEAGPSSRKVPSMDPNLK
jgi:hypothetical protein